MIKRIWATFVARCLEFMRDRASLGWNLVLPFLLVLGLAFVFSGDGRPMFKVAVVSEQAHLSDEISPFIKHPHVHFYPVSAEKLESTVQKVGRHQTDMLVDFSPQPPRYWVNPDSKNGYFLERLLLADISNAEKASVKGDAVRYIDWVLPGVLGMNMMFSCLYGVGYVIVRYRKSGYLKRLNATPLSAMEFLLAQVLSRLVLVLGVNVLVFAGCYWLMDFAMHGSFLLLFFVAGLGSFSLIALSVLITARISSEEFAGGLLNLITWPMMLLSGVWFSMEGTHPWVQKISEISPLTHMLTAARKIMLDGASLQNISWEIGILTTIAILSLTIGAMIFKWASDSH